MHRLVFLMHQDDPTQPAGQIPREQLPITLFDGVVLAVRAVDGRIYLVVRDLCTVW